MATWEWSKPGSGYANSSADHAPNSVPSAGSQLAGLEGGYSAQQAALAATPSATAGAYAPTPWLQLGSTGGRVRALQTALTTLGHSPGPVDGQFGPMTRGGLMAFQKARGIVVDGKYGPQSQGRLAGALSGGAQTTPATTNTGPASQGPGQQPAPAPSSGSGLSAPAPWLVQGAAGARVVQLQSALKSLGHSPGPLDGKFGPMTRGALMGFQKARGIAVDGKYGPQTQGHLAAALSGKPPTTTSAPTTTTSPAPGGPVPGAGTAAPNEKIDQMVSWAQSMIGTPYAAVNPYRFGEVLWPGGSLQSINGSGSWYTYPKGTRVFDCSGFVVTAHKQIGINLMSIASSGAMRSDTTILKHLDQSELRKGDLITYAPKGGVGHVVLYLGGNDCIESRGSAGVTMNSVDWGRADGFRRAT